MQVGKTKDQGLYNKPSVVMHPGALAAGTLPQYKNTIPSCKTFHDVSEYVVSYRLARYTSKNRFGILRTTTLLHGN